MSLNDPRRIDRRRFLAAAGGTVVASAIWPSITATAAIPKQGAARLCTVTYNVFACRGYPSTEHNWPVVAKARAQIPTRIALELALYEPDIITFQESPAESVVAEIAGWLGMNYTYFAGGFPGTVITRFEIAASTNRPLAPTADADDAKGLFTRHWGRANLKTDEGDLAVYSAHMFPGNRAEVREKEVSQMLAAMEADLHSGRSMILQGDLNHSPDDPEYGRWVDAGLRDMFAAAGAGDGSTFRSTQRRVRVDYIWAHGPLAERVTECRVLFEGAFRTNPGDPNSFALSDHVPVLAVFE